MKENGEGFWPLAHSFLAWKRRVPPNSFQTALPRRAISKASANSASLGASLEIIVAHIWGKAALQLRLDGLGEGRHNIAHPTHIVG